jgi:hypothetical protein
MWCALRASVLLVGAGGMLVAAGAYSLGMVLGIGAIPIGVVALATRRVPALAQGHVTAGVVSCAMGVGAIGAWWAGGWMGLGAVAALVGIAIGAEYRLGGRAGR